MSSLTQLRINTLMHFLDTVLHSDQQKQIHVSQTPSFHCDIHLITTSEKRCQITLPGEAFFGDMYHSLNPIRIIQALELTEAFRNSGRAKLWKETR